MKSFTISPTSNLIAAISKIGGYLAIFRIAALIIAFYNKKRFERILKQAITKDNDKQHGVEQEDNEIPNAINLSVSEPNESENNELLLIEE